MPIILLFVFCIYHENCIQIHINILSFYLFCFGPSFAVARKHCVKLRACTRQRINWLGHETISKLSTLSIKIVKHQYFTGFNASNEAGTITSAKNKLYNTHTHTESVCFRSFSTFVCSIDIENTFLKYNHWYV